MKTKQGRKPSLTPRQVALVHDLYFRRITPDGGRYRMSDLAELFGVTHETISRAIHLEDGYKNQCYVEAVKGGIAYLVRETASA
jgi:hypothetical protein